jgi:hypothetical protein
MITDQKKLVKKGQFLDNQFVDTVLRTYKQQKWVHNSERIGKEDTLTSWVSLEEMEELVEKIRMHGGNGIRICFAAYPKDHSEEPELAGRQSVVLIGTRSAEDGTTNKNLYLSDGANAEILAFGKFPGCPPFCFNSFAQTGDPDLGRTLVDRGDLGLSVI